MPQAHDFNMWVNFCLAGHNLFVIKEKLVKYRQFKKLTSLSSNNERMRKRLIFDQEKILENFLKISDPKKFKKIFSNISFKENKIDLLLFELALDTINNYKDKFSHYQFSLNYIYKYLLNLKTRKEVEENYGFGVNDLYKIIEFNPIGVLSEKANQKPLYRRVLKRLSKLPFGFKNIIYS
jgi:hypothetical protein